MSFDGNAWYWITETRVNWTSGLFYNGASNELYFGAADNTSVWMQWQLFQVRSGVYQFRNRGSNIKKQLGACYVSDEASPSKTQPCMPPADDSQAQRWSITEWEDGNGYKIVNKHNGTALNLDWHPGGPGFLSPTTAEAPIQPAQHWLFSSVAVVNDGVFSTSVADPTTSQTSKPTSTPTETSTGGTATGTAAQTGAGTAALATSTSGSTSEKSSTSSRLSSGAAAGIGVGVAVVILAVAAALLFFLLKKKKRRQQRSNTAELAGTAHPYHDDIHKGSQEPKYANHPIYEAPNNTGAPHELYSNPAELGADSSNAVKSPTMHNTRPYRS